MINPYNVDTVTELAIKNQIVLNFTQEVFVGRPFTSPKGVKRTRRLRRNNYVLNSLEPGVGVRKPRYYPDLRWVCSQVQSCLREVVSTVDGT